MRIKRTIFKSIVDKLSSSNKIIVIYGARQVGKTTLAKEILSFLDKKIISINADENKYVDILSSRDLNKIRSLLSGYEIAFIDEVQRIPEIGVNLKIISDGMPEIKVIATGSSSLDLSSKIREPLTGRSWTYHLYPFSQMELLETSSVFDLKDQVGKFLVYGAYPEVFTLENMKDKERLLIEIGTSYLYRDILELGSVRHASKIKNLLKLLAFQIGSEVSLNELSINLGLSHDSVERYIDLLEKSFVIFRLSGFSRNLRKEVSKKDKIFFWDLGIRNMLIDNFKSIPDRDDIGRLWENFIIAERQKYMFYSEKTFSSYFWRTHTGAELDYVEDASGKLAGYEIKYSKTRKKAPETWTQTYPGSTFSSINKENYLEFLK